MIVLHPDRGPQTQSRQQLDRAGEELRVDVPRRERTFGRLARGPRRLHHRRGAVRARPAHHQRTQGRAGAVLTAYKHHYHFCTGLIN